MAIQGISAFLPSITSSGVFSFRKVDSAANSTNPFVGAMNMDIAGGQVLNAAKGVSNVAKYSKGSISSGILSAEESIKNLAKTDKIVGGISKVLNFTANNINPIICATGVAKVACAKDEKRTETAIEEGTALGVMFGSETLAKRIIGIPKNMKFDSKTMTEKEDGIYKIVDGKEELIAKKGEYKLTDKQLVVNREGWYKESTWLKKQTDAIKDYCETKKVLNRSIKFLPGTLKGIGFVCASIGGYNLGLSAADMILGKESA